LAKSLHRITFRIVDPAISFQMEVLTWRAAFVPYPVEDVTEGRSILDECIGDLSLAESRLVGRRAVTRANRKVNALAAC
jgi:hypothetical protein